MLAFKLIMGLAPVIFGVAWGIRETQTLTVPEIWASEGFRYASVLRPSVYRPFFDVEGDALRQARRAQTRIYENGRRLGPPHRPHDYIREDGGGQFSHWGATLDFSTSDNSYSRADGRTYTVVTSATLPVEVLWIFVLFFLASAFLQFWLPVNRSQDADRPGAWNGLGAMLLVALYAWVGVTPSPPNRRYRCASVWRSGRYRCWHRHTAWRSGEELVRLGPALLRDARTGCHRLLATLDGPFARPGWHGWIFRAASLAFPFTVFAALLRLPLPPDVLVGSYYFITPIALPAGIALSLCHKRRDWIGVLAGLTITLALFALPLATLWQHFASHDNAVGGLLPFSDASGYDYDARRLTEGHTLGWSARRPLFAALFGTLLATTGQNLQISLAALVAINAIVTFLLARELRVSHGPVAAAVVTVVLFLDDRIGGLRDRPD